MQWNYIYEMRFFFTTFFSSLYIKGNLVPLIILISLEF